MAAGKGIFERIWRGLRTVYFMLTMAVSLLVLSVPVLVAAGDILILCGLVSSFTCLRCCSFKDHLLRYDFRNSLLDIPVVSVVRSLVIICIYSLHGGSGLSHGPYLGTTTLCSCVSILFLSVKACLFTATSEAEAEASFSLPNKKLQLKKSWGMLVLFLSSLVFALVHVIVAYRTSCKAWRKLLFHSVDPEAVDLLLAFCAEMGFSSAVLVGHDDGGLLVLKAVEKVRASDSSIPVEIKGVVLLSVNLSREVVPGFARMLLHTSLVKRHMVRPLLRTEITQVVNRRAWYDTTKLTTEILNLYKAPLCVEGWDDALQEISRLSYASVLSSQNASALLKSVKDLPVLVVAGAEDALVSLKSSQAMASKLENSRLVAISGCGHLPHEECPKALLAALSPFITRLLSPNGHQQGLQKQ